MSDDKYWNYLKARENLKTRLQATDEEISIWTYLGHDDGGIDGFDNPKDHKKDRDPKRHFTDCPRKAYFLRAQIESFNPDDNRRFLTLQQLTDRWVVRDVPKELVQDHVDAGDLEPVNVLRGYSEQWEEHTKVLQEGETVLIPDSSLFALDQVLEIEAREFPSVKSDPELTESNADQPWITFCKSQIDDIFQSQIASGKAATKEYIAEELVGRCKRQKIVTKRNKPVLKENVLKQVLKDWTPPEIE